MADDYINAQQDVTSTQSIPQAIPQTIPQDDRFQSILQDVKESAANPLNETINFYHEQLANKRLAAQGFDETRIDPDKSDYENISNWKGDIGKYIMKDTVLKSQAVQNGLNDAYKGFASSLADEAGLVGSTALTKGPIPTMAIPAEQVINFLHHAAFVIGSLYPGAEEQEKEPFSMEETPEQRAIRQVITSGIERGVNVPEGYQPTTIPGRIGATAGGVFPFTGNLAESFIAGIGSEAGRQTMKDLGFKADPQEFGSLIGMVGAGMAAHNFVNPALPVEDARAVRNGIYENPSPEIKKEAAAVVDNISAQKGLVSAEPTETLHELVRRENPEVFNEYDKITQQHKMAQQNIRNADKVFGDEYDQRKAELEEQKTKKEKDVAAQPDRELAEKLLQSDEKYRDIQNQLALLGTRDAYIEAAQAKARQDFLSTGQRLEELSPKVRSIYQEATPRYKETVFNAPAPPQPFTEIKLEIAPQEISEIATDAKNRLLATGRSEKQADAESQLIAARYETAAQNGWTKGSAKDIYTKHMAQISATKAAKEKNKMLASKILEQKQAGYSIIGSLSETGKPIIKLLKGNNASTIMHEMAHIWLDEMVGWEKAEGAPADLKAHMEAVRDYLGNDKGEYSGFTEDQHEKFAESFELYLRDGVAPSHKLANAFAHFKEWLMKIYTTVQKLNGGKDISPEIRNVFDHMLAKNPERITVVPENVQHMHIAIAERTLPEKAASEGDKIEAAITRLAENKDKEIASGIRNTESATRPASSAGEAQLSSATEGAKPGEKGTPERTGAVSEGARPATPESTPISTERGARGAGRIGGSTELKEKSKPVKDLFTEPKKGEELKAGNIRMENLTTDDDVISAAVHLAKNNPEYFNHQVTSDMTIAEMAKALGVKSRDMVLDKLREIAVNNDVPLAALARASRDMFTQEMVNLKEKAKSAINGSAADKAAATKALSDALYVGQTLSGITYESGLLLRSFRDISGQVKEARDLEQLLKQVGSTPQDMDRLFQMIADSTDKQMQEGIIAKRVQATTKPGFFRTSAAYYRCWILSNIVTHAAWTVGGLASGVYQGVVESALTGVFNKLGVGGEETGTTITGGMQGMYRALSQGLPTILYKTLAAAQSGKTDYLPSKDFLRIYTTEGGLEKTMRVDVQKLVENNFDPTAIPSLKKLMDSMQSASPEEAQKFKAELDSKIQEQKELMTRQITTELGAKLKTWGDLAHGLKEVGETSLAAMKNGLSNIRIGEGKLFEVRYQGRLVPNFYVKGLPIPVGSVAEGLSSRIYATVHTLTHEWDAMLVTKDEARKAAVSEGKMGDAIEERANELIESPTQAMANSINNRVNKMTFMSADSEMTKAFLAMRGIINAKAPGLGTFLMPVITPSTEAAVGLSKRLPTALWTNRAALMGEKGALEQQQAWAQVTAGSMMLLLSSMYLAQRGVTTPSPSANAADNELRTTAGQQPASIRIGDMMVPLQHVPIVGQILALGADIVHIKNIVKGEDLSQRLGPAMESAFNNLFMHEFALSNLVETVDAARGKEDAASFLKRQAGSAVPGFMSGIAQMVDPYKRQGKDIGSYMESHIPFLSENLPPQINSLTGEPIPSAPFKTASAKPDPIASTLLPLGIHPTNPRPVINDVQLMPQQGAEFASTRGHILHDGLEMLIEGEGKEDFNAADKNEKRKMIMKVEKHATDCAKSVMFNRYPQLLKDANDKYEASCRGEDFNYSPEGFP